MQATNISQKTVFWLGYVFVPLLVALVPLGYNYLNKSTKELSYTVINKYQLINNELPIEGVDINYLGNSIKNLEIVSVRIQNSGDIPIEAKDFEGTLNIFFPDDTSIYSAKLGTRTPEDLKPTITNKNNLIEISPLLLNPNDNFLIDVALSKYVTPLKVNARISGVKLISEKEKFHEDKFIKIQHRIILAAVIAITAAFYLLVGLSFGMSNLINFRKEFISPLGISRAEAITIITLLAMCPSGLMILYTNSMKDFRWFDILIPLIPMILSSIYHIRIERKIKLLLKSVTIP